MDIDRDIEQIAELTAANEHSRARELAADILSAECETRRGTAGNLIEPLADALRGIRTMHDRIGHITPEMFRLRETLWRLAVETAEAMGAPYADAARRMNAAM